MNYKLHYADKLLKGDIKEYDFDKFSDVQLKVDELLTKDDFETAWLFTSEVKKDNRAEGQIIISHNRDHIMEYVIDEHYFTKLGKSSYFWLYALSSYEDAYKIAIDMKEVNPLGYTESGGNSSDY